MMNLCKAVIIGLAIGFISLASWGISGAPESLPSLLSALMESQPAHAQNSPEAWKKEFEAICSKTDDAMTLTKDELKDLVERCEKLKPMIEKLDESQRKVYLKRLQSCRDLF